VKHCRHCDPLCEGGETEYIGSGVRIRAHGTEYATWLDGHCPACAEAALIAAYLRDAAARKRATLYAAADVVEYGIRKRAATARGGQ
jgi:hypothetical protein